MRHTSRDLYHHIYFCVCPFKLRRRSYGRDEVEPVNSSWELSVCAVGIILALASIIEAAIVLSV